MKLKKIRPCIIARCIVFCMMCSQLFSIVSYAENSTPTLRVGEQSIQLSVQPTETDLGMMIEAKKIAEAFGMPYQFDAGNQSFTITDQTYGTVTFMHNATTYSMNGSTHSCQPYFYVSNTIPMIELGFFCNIFGISYRYDEANNTIYADRSTVYATRSTTNLNGTLSVDATAEIPSNGLNVTLYLEDATSIYHENLINETHKLGTLHLTQNAPNDSFSYNTTEVVPGAQYYSLLYRVNDAQDSVVATGYVNTNGGIQGVELLNQHYGNPMRFSAGEISNVNICIPAFAYQPCGTDSYWTFDKTTGTLHIKGTGSVTNNGWKLLSEYITTVKVDPGISSFSTQMPMKLQRLELPDTITEIGDRAFAYCDELRTVTYSGSKTEWDAVSVGNDNDSLTSATIDCSDSNNVSVIYYNNGGSGSPESEEFTKNTSVTISSVAPVREGFKFLGWATSPTATAAQYAPGTRVTVGNSHLELYAVWVWDDASILNGSCGTNLTWEYYSNGLLKITGSGAMDDYEDLKDIPWYGIRANVTALSLSNEITKIGDYAFHNFYNLTNVTIPNSVTSIGKYAFYTCHGLKGITIPDTVTSIGDCAFGYCDSLTNINIPKSVKSIGDCTFYNCSSLTNITIPESVTSIGASAFEDCHSLESITIQGNVTSIGNYAFRDCNRLTSINIPESVTSIGVSAFEDCHSLANININGVTSIGISAFEDCRSLANISINGVTGIGNYAFYNCSSLTKITIQSGDTSIDDYAFYNCGSLTSINIPNGVTSIGNYAFYNCSSLTSINSPDGVASIGNYAFYNCSNLTSITIQSGATSIGEYAFKGCSKLASITIPGSVTSIGDYAFEECGSLTSINILDGVTSIGDYAFHKCGSLKNITIPNSVTNIGIYAFWRCYELTSITIPDKVTTINASTFYYCTHLKSIAIPNSVTRIDNAAFAYCNELTDIYYSGTENEWNNIKKADDVSTKLAPLNIHYNSYRGSCGTNLTWEYYSNGLLKITGSGAMDDYESLEDIPWYNIREEVTALSLSNGITKIGDYAFSGCIGLTNITIPESVTSIGKYAFYNCDSLTSINIPDGVTSIGDYAFSGCIGLTNITIPESVTSIGDYAFQNLNKLTEITIPGSVTSIGDYAFSGCIGLTNVTIPESVTSIGNYAFSGCIGLTNVTIQDGVTSIGDYAFGTCSSLTNITIPNSVTSMGDYVLVDCSSLAKITIPGSVTSIGKYAFSGCKALAEITIQSGVTSIGEYAFSGCSKLTSITIPGSVTSIGNYAFYNCGNLTSINILNGVTSIGDYVFQNCYILADITIPNSVTSIGKYAFYNCNHLTSITIPDNVTTINTFTFYYCTRLESIAISNSVTRIDNAAFAYCSKLTDIYYSGTEIEWSNIQKATDVSTKLDKLNIHYNSYIDVKSTSCSYKTNEIAAKIDFDYVLEDTIIYLAIYDDADNSLLKVGSADVASGDTTATITIPTDTDFTGYAYKIMLWNPANLAPYTAYIDGAIQKN